MPTYINNYTKGNIRVIHKDKSIITSYGSKEFEEFMSSVLKLPSTVGYIPAGYEHRPDLISNLFYDTVTWDWLIVMVNNVKDVLQELNVGDKIILPNLI